MDAIRQWAFGACAAAVACGLLRLVLPESGIQRVFNVTASVFFLGCLLSPLFLSLPEVESYALERDELKMEVERRSAELSAVAEESGRRLAEDAVRREAGRVLDELGVEGGKISVNVHDTAEGGISISECEVQLPGEYAPRRDEIREALARRLGTRILIGYEVENKE